MLTGSSFSPSLSKKTKKCSSSSTPSPSTLKIARSRRKGADRIDHPKDRASSYSKRSKGLIKKASTLSSLTGAMTIFIALLPTATSGELHYFGAPSIHVVFFEFLRQWRDSPMTKKHCTFMIMECDALLKCLREKEEDLENKPAVNAGAGHESRVGVGAGNDSKIFNGDEINSHETSHPSRVAGVHHDICSSSLVGSATTNGESSGMDSDPMCSDFEIFGLDTVDNFSELGEFSNFWDDDDSPNPINSAPSNLSEHNKTASSSFLQAPDFLSTRNSSNMNTGSSSSFSPTEKTKKRSSSSTPSRSTPKNSPSRRKGANRIVNPKERTMTYGKMSRGLIKKTSTLSSLTGAPTALIVLPHKVPKGKLYYFGTPSVYEVCFKLLRQMCASRMTEEDRASMIKECKAIRKCLQKKLQDLENYPAVNAGDGHESRVGVGAGNDFKILNGHGNYETSHPSSVEGDHRDICLTSPVNSAPASGESLGMDSGPMECSELEGFGLVLDSPANSTAKLTLRENANGCIEVSY